MPTTGGYSLPQIADTNESSLVSQQQVHSSKHSRIGPSSQFQMTEIDDEAPLVKLTNRDDNAENDTLNNVSIVEGNIYQASWSRLVGTDLIYNEHGELVAKVRDHLACNEAIKILKNEKGKNEELSVSEEEENGTKKDDSTAFLRKAIRLAKKKAADEA